MAIINKYSNLTPREQYLRQVEELADTLKSVDVTLTEELFQLYIAGGGLSNTGIRNFTIPICSSLKRLGDHQGIRPEDICIKDGKASYRKKTATTSTTAKSTDKVSDHA